MALPEFAGKIVHFEDVLAEIGYDRLATTCSSAGLYLDLRLTGTTCSA
jgi:hypothetical protein